MKAILFCLVLFVTGCSGQDNSKHENELDTVLLFNPKPNSVYREEEVFSNSAILAQQQYGLNIHGKLFSIKNDAQLFKEIDLNKNEIVKTKFFLVIDSNVSFSRTVAIINRMKSAGVENYKVLNLENFFKHPPPSVLAPQAPTVISTITPNNDSTFLNIEFLQTGYLVSFLNKKMTLKSDIELDNFIRSNNELIDKRKVQIITTKQTGKRALDVLPIFRKHDIQNFLILNK